MYVEDFHSQNDYALILDFGLHKYLALFKQL